MKIIVIGGFSFTEDQKVRLDKVGTVEYKSAPGSADKWLQEVKGADIIASDGDFLLENIYNLKNVFVTYPYIELGVFDSEKLAVNGVFIANTQGSNRDSIVEWVIFMVIALLRKLPTAINTGGDYKFERTQSLAGKNALVIGKGSIGKQVGVLCEAFGMNVDYFSRGDNLLAKAKGASVLINCLNCNSTSKNLLNNDFFMNLDPGSLFVSFVRPYTYDVDALIESLDMDILSGAAIDCDPEIPGNTTNDLYKKVSSHSKILATPHVAFGTEQAGANGAEILISNIEAFAAGKKQNVLHKL